MRTLGIGVLALGLMMAFASAVFIWSDRTCSIGTGFCHHPLLLFVPVLATLAWGLLLKLNEQAAPSRGFFQPPPGRRSL
jgi:hypothetical protein